MFVGRSPEEIELAGEESSSGSWFDKLKQAIAPVVSPLMPGAKKIVDVAQSPAGKAAGMFFFPQATAALAIAQGLKGGAQGQQPPQSPQSKQPQPKGKSEAGYWVRRRRGGSVMGAAAPMSKDEVMALIRREPHPVKRERMLINYMRSIGR